MNQDAQFGMLELSDSELEHVVGGKKKGSSSKKKSDPFSLDAEISSVERVKLGIHEHIDFNVGVDAGWSMKESVHG